MRHLLSIKQIKGIDQLTNIANYTQADLTSLENRVGTLENSMNKITSQVIQDIIDQAPGEINSIDDVASIIKYYPYNSSSVVFDQLYHKWTQIVTTGTIDEYEPYKYEFNKSGAQCQNLFLEFNTTPTVIDIGLEIEATANIWIFMIYTTVNTRSTTYPYIGLLWDNTNRLLSVRRQTANNGSATTMNGTTLLTMSDGTTTYWKGHIMYLHDPARGEYLYQYNADSGQGNYFPWTPLMEKDSKTTLNLKHIRFNCNKAATAAAYSGMKITYFRAYSLHSQTVNDEAVDEPYSKTLLSSWNLTTPETDQNYPFWESIPRLRAWEAENTEESEGETT